MGFKCGLVGLPNVGKSTLFSAITSVSVEAANFPFCTVEPNWGVVPVKDHRLAELADVSGCEKQTPATLTIVDIAGLIAGSSRGEGLGNRFLGHIREMDLLLHVVRSFEAPDVSHLPGEPDPLRDIEIVQLELILADLESLEKRLAKLEYDIKARKKEAKAEENLIQRAADHLNQGLPLRSMTVASEEMSVVSRWQLLTGKPVVFVLNIDESALGQEAMVDLASAIAETHSAPVLSLCASLEAELAILEPEEQMLFQEEYGLQERGLDRLIKLGYDYLGLVTFFTVKGTEARAWPVVQSTTAKKGAGKVHSEMEKGFIAVEVIRAEELIGIGSLSAAREKGLLRMEGKEYKISDGDVLFFRFKV